MADFPMIFCVRCTVAEERLAERLGVWSFGTYPLPGNPPNILLISAFFAKRTVAGTPVSGCKIARSCLVPNGTMGEWGYGNRLSR
jgi:hypothetical protein